VTSQSHHSNVGIILLIDLQDTALWLCQRARVKREQAIKSPLQPSYKQYSISDMSKGKYWFNYHSELGHYVLSQGMYWYILGHPIIY